jgi:hypothetical protein
VVQKKLGNARKGPAVTKAAKPGSRSLTVGLSGVRTSKDFSDFMSGLMSDLVEGKVTPQIGNAACNAGGKLLKAVEMQYKYGSPLKARVGNELLLSSRA